MKALRQMPHCLALIAVCGVVRSVEAALPRPLPATLPASAAVEDSILQRAIDDLPLRAHLLDKDAQTDVRIVNVAAHPDDEDGQTLTALRHEYGYQTHILYMTRGEGGQNEAGPELGDDLGLLRSLECQSAAEGYGATISFLNCPDFGYSKTAKETLARWGEQNVLARLMDELRLLDADVVITHHTPWEGHGHHRATSVLLRRACRELQRLGDPAAPALLLELTADPDSATVAVDASGAAPGVPWSFAGRAHVALRRHVSQGMGLGPVGADEPRKAYRAVEEVGNADAISRWAGQTEPWAADGLAALVPTTADRDAESLRARASRLRRGEVFQIERDLAWLRMHKVPNRAARPLTIYDVAALRLTGPAMESLADITVEGGVPEHMVVSLGRAQPDSAWVLSYRQDVPSGGPWSWIHDWWVPTSPRHLHLRERRTVADSVDVRMTRRDGELERLRLALHERTSEVFELRPPRAYAVPGARTRFTVRAWGFDPSPDREGLDASPRLRVQPSGTGRARSSAWAARAGTGPDGPCFESVVELAPNRRLAKGKVLKLQIRRSGGYADPVGSFPVVRTTIPRGLRLAIACAADTLLAQQLRSAAVPVSILDARALVGGSLQAFNTLVLDARAYALHPELRRANDRLLDWVRTGGHLVVLMHKSFDWQPSDATTSELPPLPLHVGRDRVCEEDAPITVLAPQHPFFRFPHELDAATWTGWHQERGLYYPDAWDPAFAPLLRMSDTDEPPLDSAILCARVGDGAYTYTCLAWSRQLREAHPGALLAFINLLSWPLAPACN